MENVWIHSEYTRNDRKQLQQMNVMDTVGRLDDVVVKNLLFIHAFGGCNTTSAIHDKGKTAIHRLLQK